MPSARLLHVPLIGCVLDLLLVWVLTLPVWWPLTYRRMVGTHDGSYHLYRLLELDRAVRAGELYPRWAPDFALGYGYPVFDFYAPLALYLALPFRMVGLGPIAALALAQLLLVLVAGASMYLLARDIFGRPAAVVAAVLYASAPYLLVDLYVRGALAETAGLALLPGVIWALRRVAAQPTAARLAVGAAAVGALALAHNITFLLGLPVALLLTAPQLATGASVPPGSLRRGVALLGSVLLGLALSAIYWLPALGERGFVHAERLTTLFYDFHNHFQPLGALVQTTLAFEYRYDFFGGFLFRAGLLQVLLAALGAGLALAMLPRHRPTFLLLAGAAVAALLLQSGASAPVWETLPLLPFVQFPWRLLIVLALASALLAAAPVAVTRRPALRVAAATAVIALWGYGSLAALRPELLDLHEDEVSVGALGRVELDRRLVGTTTSGEYTPRWVARDTFDGWRDPFPAPERPARVLRAESLGPTTTRLEVEPTGGTLLLDSYFFPGWTANADGESAPTRPLGDRALLAVDVPPGARSVVVEYAGTTLQRVSRWIALFAFGALAALLLAGRVRPRWLAAAPLAAPVALAMLAPPPLAAATLPDSPAAFHAGPRLLGAQLDSRGALLLHWTADASTDRELRVAVRLLDEGGRVAQRRDKPPRYGLRPTSAWAPGVLVRDRQEVDLPPPGEYQLVVGLHDERGYVEPTAGAVVRWSEPCPCAAPTSNGIGVRIGTVSVPAGASTRPLALGDSGDGPIAAAAIQLAAARVGVAGPGPEPPAFWAARLTRLMGRVPLVRRAFPTPLSSPAPPSIRGGPSGVAATVRSGDRLIVDLRWRGLADVYEDYAAFVHLLDQQQRMHAQDDDWPRRGFSPTSLWRTGDVIDDRLELEVPSGTAPGRYSLVAGLYTRGDLTRLHWSGDPPGRDAVPLGLVKVRPPPATTPVAAPIGADFGGAIRLAGLLEPIPAPIAPGTPLVIRPRWEVLASPGRDYTVFVHLIADDGARMVAQGDAPPLGDRYPTSFWESGEVVDDAYALSLPGNFAGPASIVVGFYRPDTQERLLLPDGSSHAVVARFEVRQP